MARSKSRQRPAVARTVGKPHSVSPKIEAIRRLTKEIKHIVAHISQDTKRVRDVRSRLALERKCNQRGELLERLKQEDSAAHQSLIAELNLD